MARSSFDRRSDAAGRQPWTAVWTPGVNLVNFFDLYDSKGDVTISTATSIPTTLDGPIQVVRYGALTVNAAVTAAQRCRGLIILSDSLSVGAAGSISMTARGAAGAKNWAVDKDIFVPQAITFSGKNTSYADFLKWIRTTGYCIFDPSLYACPPPGMGDVQCDWTTWTPLGRIIISAAGCGAAAICNTGATYSVAGNAGTTAPGSGGTGCGHDGGSTSGKANPWAGGVGGTAFSYSGSTADPYGSFGGTLLPPGVVLVVCRGAVSATSGASISANGTTATVTNNGGTGGGKAALYYYSGSVSGLSITATAGAGMSNGAAGGAGHAESQTFAAMGWS